MAIPAATEAGMTTLDMVLELGRLAGLLLGLAGFPV